MKNGWVKRIVSDKGFGFIRDDRGEEYFFHRNEMDRAEFEQLQENSPVSFEPDQGPKGPRASNVHLL